MLKTFLNEPLDLKSLQGKKILITGKTGQLARALSDHLKHSDSSSPENQPVTLWGRKEFPLDQPEVLKEHLNQLKPDIILNAGAYTAVDLAEKESPVAERVNAQSVGEIARWCEKNRAKLVHFSTDYVFPGDGEKPWRESDTTHPLNAYGLSKLHGEKEVQQSGTEHLIFRLCWVYDSVGKNFFNTMLRLGSERKELKIVDDQWGAPSYAPHLAEATLRALALALKGKASVMSASNSGSIQSAFPSGIYHLCHAGETTWHGFALEIFNRAKSNGISLAIENVQGISSHEYPTPAKRPLNSRMSCEKFHSTFGFSLPSWQKGLEDCYLERVHRL